MREMLMRRGGNRSGDEGGEEGRSLVGGVMLSGAFETCGMTRRRGQNYETIGHARLDLGVSDLQHLSACVAHAWVCAALPFGQLCSMGLPQTNIPVGWYHVHVHGVPCKHWVLPCKQWLLPLDGHHL